MNRSERLSHGVGRIPGGIVGFMLLAAAIAIDEVASVYLGGNLGAFLWTTFHFILNPILCVIYIVFTIVKGIRARSLKLGIVYLILILLALAYIYIAFTGNIWWPEFFGVDFGNG